MKSDNESPTYIELIPKLNKKVMVYHEKLKIE